MAVSFPKSFPPKRSDGCADALVAQIGNPERGEPVPGGNGRDCQAEGN